MKCSPTLAVRCQAKGRSSLVEVGLGGTRDATNVLHAHNLEAAVITHIEEHLDALWSIGTIVEAKAGIAHKRRHCILRAQREQQGHRATRRRAQSERGATLVDDVKVTSRLIGYDKEGATLSQRRYVKVDIKLDDNANRIPDIRVSLVVLISART